MSTAEYSFDLSQDLGRNSRVELTRGRLELELRAQALSAARDRPLLHVVSPREAMREVVLDVNDLRCDDGGTYPLVVTWELFVGGRAVLDPRPVLWRRTVFQRANQRRAGRLFGYQGPSFHQFLLVGHVRTADAATVRGYLDLTVGQALGAGGSPESVVVGSAVG